MPSIYCSAFSGDYFINDFVYTGTHSLIIQSTGEFSHKMTIFVESLQQPKNYNESERAAVNQDQSDHHN